ncbi:MAG: glucosaminidase domain-containing protein [Flavobacterium sp.]|uniref:glucosaminidase domain-containing protein n=1 Tax=Flavobacterium sp. TaxID=239 RepID=UPI003BD99666
MENEIYCYIKSIGIKNPEVVLKQAIYETGHFTSHVFKTKNNVFGFRKTMTYITFKDWRACVDYYKVWQDKKYKDTTQNYYKFIQKINYSGYSNFDYSKELKRIKIRGSLICN